MTELALERSVLDALHEQLPGVAERTVAGGRVEEGAEEIEHDVVGHDAIIP